ncbi:MAG: translation initiation factor 2 [Pseudomonadota bacterium]|nr:translation initiation factor 2 [Pseudomonadota bacterium]
MLGIHHIVIENKRLRYEFDIRRNLTVIRGNSGTGKTTMISMLRSYELDGEGSGITVICDSPCAVLNYTHWKASLSEIHDSIVFIDEDARFITSIDFARAIEHTSNYYVLITRDRLENLPYSTDEIYEIRRSQKYAGLKKTYNELHRIYYTSSLRELKQADKVITEDSNSGYQLFSAVFSKPCISGDGKAGIYAKVKSYYGQTCLIIADGAAFGPEMDRMQQLAESGYNIILYLPESFEWLILSSGILKDADVKLILSSPENFIDSKLYFSWERFFTSLLIEKTNGSQLQYSKNRLNPHYLEKNVLDKIISVIPPELLS